MRSRAAIAIFGLLLIAMFAAGAGAVRAAETPGPAPLLSRGVPAYTNDSCGGGYPASLANDASYDTQWRACSTPSTSAPVYIAYDLSAVPAANRGRVIVAWYNDPITSPYEHGYVSQAGYDIPSTYTIEGNNAPGGALPASGWVTLATVSGNTYHSREHVVDLAGAAWVRMRVTATDGSSGNFGVYLNLDVHDASAAVLDSWIFFGDSITQAGLSHNGLGVGTWAQLVNAARPSFYPAYEDGGIGGTLSADGAARIGTWLASFPGHYVALAYGSNDAGYSVSPGTYYANVASMVDAVLAAGKVPIVPKIPWGCTGALQANAPGLNARIDALYAAYPSVVRGPDLWTYFANNTNLISGDCLHPTNQGYAALRQQWANAMSASVYAGTPPPTATPTATSAPTATPTATPSTNRVANAGFESGTSGWSLASTATIDANAANAHSGTRALRLAATGAWQGTWQSVAVTAGQSYTFSAWERSSTSGGFLSVFSFNASNVQIDNGTHLVYGGTGVWTQLSGTYVPPAGTAWALIGEQSSGAGTFFFDDVFLGSGSAPTATPAATPPPTPSPTPTPTPAPTVTPSATPAPTAAPNRVANPGFESGVASWQLASTASVDANAANAHSGTGSLRLAATGAWQGTWQSVAVTPGQPYRFSAWERSTTSGGFLSVFSFNASGVQIDNGTHLVFGASAAWTQLSGTYVAPAGTAWALIGPQSSGVGTFWFDDITLAGP